MPTEVLYEIASYLPPLCLLHLSYSSRRFYNVLMSKSARKIWRNVLEEADIPLSPGDINEPQLVNLMFNKFCQGCGAPRVSKVYYDLRIRLCSGCSSINIVRGKDLQKDSIMDGIPDDDPFPLMLCASVGKSSWPVRGGFHAWRMNRKFFKPDFIDALQQYRSFKPFSREWFEFVEDRKRLAERISWRMSDIEEWFSQKRWGKTLDKKSKEKSRIESILARLRLLGYTDEDIWPVSSCCWDVQTWNRIFNQPRELTERIWKKVLPQLEEIIRSRRVEDRRRERRKEIRAFYRSFCDQRGELEGRPLVLTLGEVLQIPEVVALVEKDESQSPISEEQWNSITQSLSDANQQQEKQLRKDCVTFIVSAREAAGLPPLCPSMTDSDSDSFVLNHATSFMRCFSFNDSLFPGLITYTMVIICRRHLWWEDTETYVALPPLSTPKIAVALFRSLGLDDSFTHDDSGLFQKLFVCKCCDPGLRKKMSWMQLVNHFYEEEQWYREASKCLEDKSPDCGVPVVDSHNLEVRAELAELISQDDETIKEASDYVRQRKIPCRLCEKLGVFVCGDASRAEVEAHIRTRHGKAVIEEGDIGHVPD